MEDNVIPEGAGPPAGEQDSVADPEPRTEAPPRPQPPEAPPRPEPVPPGQGASPPQERDRPASGPAGQGEQSRQAAPAPDGADGQGEAGLRDETDGHPSEATWDEVNDRQRRARREGFAGTSVNHAEMRGVGAVGTNSQAAHTIYNLRGAGRLDVARGDLLNETWIQSTLDTYVEVPGFADMLRTLRQHGVVYLSGPQGSGRRPTAHALLAVACGPDNIVSIDLDPDAGLTTVLDQPDVLQNKRGHVLELQPTQPVRWQTLATAAGRVTARESYLVVIGPPASTVDSNLLPYAVAHDRPDAAEVLRRHLSARLREQNRCLGGCGECAGACVADYVSRCLADPAVAGHLATSPPPGETVELALRLVRMHSEQREPAEALDLLVSKLREVAVAVLQPPGDGQHKSADVHGLHRTLAYRIAYAVFYDSPMTAVFDAASALLAELSAETSAAGSRPTRAVFDGGVENLLDPRMRDRSGVAAGIQPSPDGERRARLVDPGLARAVLDVAWNDHDRVREPLLRWLFTLGGDHREKLRLRAAQAAGHLATYDFGYVYRALIRTWASSPRVRHRQAASWTLEFLAAHDGRLAARVRRQVQDWTLSSNDYLNDSAARTYATGLGARYVVDALVNLQLVAVRPVHTVSSAVAQAIAEIYRPELASLVLETLGRWVQDGELCLRVHAARALMFLTHRPAPPPDEAWPALLRLAVDGKDAWDRLVLVWCSALTEPQTAIRAWNVLLAWLVRADGTDELGEVTERFATQVLLARRLLTVRARLHLGLWTARYPQSSILNRIKSTLEG